MKRAEIHSHATGGAVLVICSDADEAARITGNLYDAQIQVVGPIHTAKMALALTGQTDAALALLAGEPTGVRKTVQLAEALMGTWGVRSMLLDEADHAALGDVEWRASDAQVSRVRQALAGKDLTV